MKNQIIWYKLLKYNQKNKLSQNEIYKLKITKYNKLFLQLGGQLVDDQIDLSDEELTKAAIISVTEKISRNDDLLGRGAFGAVYLFTNNSIVKILSNSGDYNLEFVNNRVVNALASQNLCFPKFFQMFELEKLLGGTKGIVISEKLYPINILFASDSAFKISPSEVLNLEKQICFILFSLYDFYLKTGKLIIHNDFKVDNLLLRKIEDPSSTYKYTASNGRIIEVPYINVEGNKYLVVLNDYGESYTFDGAINSSRPGNILNWKYIGDGITFNNINVSSKLFNNYYNYLQKVAKLELANLNMMTNYDKLLNRSLTNQDRIFGQLQSLLSGGIPRLIL